jgi:hypothetical protein
MTEQQVQGTEQGTIPAQPSVSPVEQAPKPEAIPYGRFAEVVAQKNQAAAEVQALKEQMKNLANVITGQPSKSNLPKFETAEELTEYTIKMAEDRVSAKIQEAEQKLLQRDRVMTFTGQVENYFSANPNAAQLRNEMNAYTAGLNQDMQEAIINSVAQGRTDMLDMIYSLVAAQNQGKLKNMAEENRNRQAPMATGPNTFRSVRVGEPTWGEQIKQARDTKNFLGVWGQVARDAGVPNR